MENKKGNLSIIFLVIAIILIVVMGVFMYMQKTEADRQIAELENNASELQETINDLQGKIDSISNTINSNNTTTEDNIQDKDEMVSNKEEVKYDVEVTLEEIENIKIDITNNASMRAFYDKYYGKTLKVTGYVSAFGNEYDSFLGNEFATGVNIGNSETYETRVYAYGVTYDSKVAKKINDLKMGQKISIIGTLPNPDETMSSPVGLKALDIIVE